MSRTSFPGDRERSGEGSLHLDDTGLQPMAAPVEAPPRTPSGAHRAARPLRGTLHDRKARPDKGRTVSGLWRLTMLAILVPTLAVIVTRAFEQWPHAASEARTIVTDVVKRPGAVIAKPISAIAGPLVGVPGDVSHASITLRSDPPAEVWIDGRKVGETPLEDLAIDIGPHEIRFRNDAFDRVHEVVATRAQPIIIAVDADHP